MDEATETSGRKEEFLRIQVKALGLQITTYRAVIAENAAMMSRERMDHEQRVQELLEANNRYLERARNAETALAAALATIPEASHVGS